jgi:ubiquinone/menaquinone biosynthesis C-methylase UbiE
MIKVDKEKIEEIEKNLTLEEIVPDYTNSSFILRKYCWNRLYESINICKPLIKNKMKILDAGCGSGNLLKLLEEKISLDNNLYGLDYNKNINQINLSFTRLIRGDLRNLPFKEEVFDIIFCLDVLEHIKEVNKAIDEVKRILKKEGYIIVCQPIEGLIYKAVKFLLKGQISNIGKEK